MGNEPASFAGGSEQSPVEEIEQMEPTQTPPETTHEEVGQPGNGDVNEGESIVNEVAVEQPAPTSAPAAAPEPEPVPVLAPEEINEPVELTTLKPQGARKKPAAEEDPSVDEEFAKQLDLSCASNRRTGKESIPVPEIENAIVTAYSR